MPLSASSMPETNPILIVGAGPTGLTAAMELSRMGVPVRLIDQRVAPSTTSRALAVQARTLELLAQRGLTAEMLHRGNIGHAATLYGNGRQLAKVNLSEIESRYNYILLLAQSETENLLREQVQRQGVAVEWSTELIGFAQNDAGVRAVLRRPDGQLEEVALAYLISAEGAHSLVRHTLNMPFPGKSLPQHYALADLHLDGDIPDDELSIFLSDKGFLAVFPMKDRRFRFIALDPTTHEGTASDPTLGELQHLYDAVGHIPVRLRDMNWSSRFNVNSRMVEHLQAGRVFLGGDAAHIHSPAGGQGMNTGIQDMINLGWKLALVWHGHATPALLATYEQDRLPVIRGVVNTTEKATDAFNSNNPLVYQVVTHALPLFLNTHFVQHLGTGAISQTSANYRASDLSQTQHAGGHLHGGDRVPDLDVLAGEAGSPAALYSLLDPSRFTLLLVGGASLPPDWQQQLRPWQSLLSVQAVASAPEATESFQTAFGHKPVLLLVRPDAYLGLVTEGDGWLALLAWLGHWLPVSEAQQFGLAE